MKVSHHQAYFSPTSEKPLLAQSNVNSIFIGGLHNFKRGIKRSCKNLLDFLKFVRTRLKVSRLSEIEQKKIVFRYSNGKTH